MTVKLSEPAVIAESHFVNEPGVDRWGFYQFPSLDRLLDGRIAVTFHINRDSALDYGKATTEPNRGVSVDDGRTWTRVRSDEPVAGLKLANGERLFAGRPEATPLTLPKENYTLPKQRGVATGSYGQQLFECYRHDELPAKLQGVPLMRMKPGAIQWERERARLDDPELLRYTAEGVFPVCWLGDVSVFDNGSLLAVVYPRRVEGPEFRHWHSACYRSDDGGRSWQIQGPLYYRPDHAADVLAKQRDGFTEPASVLLPGGELLAVVRTTDGNGDGPLYQLRSSDAGRTWSQPKVIRPNGVLPRLLRLGNGVLVLSTGRPGAELLVSQDGRGEHWSEPHPLVAVTSDYNQHDSCGYTSLLALDDDTFLVAYSWFQKPAGNGQTRKAILVRRVQVSGN